MESGIRLLLVLSGATVGWLLATIFFGDVASGPDDLEQKRKLVFFVYANNSLVDTVDIFPLESDLEGFGRWEAPPPDGFLGLKLAEEGTVDSFPRRSSTKTQLCIGSHFGRLNNQVREFEAAIALAILLNWTVVAPAHLEIVRILDVNTFEAIRENLISFEGVLCPEATNLELSQRKFVQGSLHDEGFRDSFKAAAKGKVWRISAANLFLSRQSLVQLVGSEIDHLFWKHFRAKSKFEEEAEDFVRKRFRDKPFYAVHLRHLEGTCVKRMKRNFNSSGRLCGIQWDRFMHLSKIRPGTPVYVASDMQDRNALTSFLQKGAIASRKDPIVEFLIAARSSFFVGIATSTASQSIEHLRQHRFRSETIERTGEFRNGILDETEVW